MKGFLIMALLGCTVLNAANVVVKNGTKAWNDREFFLADLPEVLEKAAPSVPEQSCTGYTIKFPAGCKKALIALCIGDGAIELAKKYNMQPWGEPIYVGSVQSPRLIKFIPYVITDPPAQLPCAVTKAGGILLALDDAIPSEPAPVPKKVEKVDKNLKKIDGVQKFQAQEYHFSPGARVVDFYVRSPEKGINANTGIMLVSHNWGGTWEYTAPWCDILSNRYNLICLSVNYLQSGESVHKEVPYDNGLLQAMDCLRALYHIQKQLDDAKIPFNRNRIYASGASGGGNISLMVNKLAPATFACIVDLCGMPGLTDEVAFGIGKLNAGYSRDPKSPKYLTPAMREIRDPGFLKHLAIQKKANANNKVVIVHGLDDDYCNPADKMSIAANMVRAGFRPDTHFLTPIEIDGAIVQSTGHSIGDRPEVIAKFGGTYLAESGKFALQRSGKSDLDMRHEVVYPVTGGKYIISYAAEPVIRFEKD